MFSPISSIIHNKRVVPVVFLAPFMIVFLVFKVYPVILAVIMSFQNFQGVQSQEWVGLANYQNVFQLVRFNQAVTNTTVYTVGTLLILIPLPLVLAVLFGSNLCYATPIAYQTNMLIMAEGSYEFKDYVRTGVPLVLIMVAMLSLALVVTYEL